MAPLGFPYKLMLLEPTKSCAMPTMVSDSDSRKQRFKVSEAEKQQNTAGLWNIWNGSTDVPTFLQHSEHPIGQLGL